MASPAQIRANRANSARSTGPRTEKGKQISSNNALRHGLTSQQLLIGDEIEEDYDALLDALMASHQPANAAESILVSQIAEDYWRLLRARRIENASWERDINAIRKHFQPQSPDRELAHIFSLNDKGLFDRLMRYQASIERSYYRAIKQLEHLQLTRKKAEQPVGFVSQKAAPRRAPVQKQSISPILNPLKSAAAGDLADKPAISPVSQYDI